jgi:COP9 signalosome complex subunit 6
MQYNDSALLLGFHPDEVINHTVGAKLPLTIYESLYEVDDQNSDENDEDKKMDDGESKLKLKFRDLPYTVEAGDAEMISMDFVAKNSGNASAGAAPEPTTQEATSSDRKGKKMADGEEGAPTAEGVVLTREEDTMVTALVAKSNAIKMLGARIELITKYLESLPPAYLSGEVDSADTTAPNQLPPSHTILRQIQALVARLDLVVPSNEAAFQREMQKEANDVDAISLLNDIVQGVSSLGEVGRKFSTAENSKARNRVKTDFSQPSMREPHVLI